MKKIIDFLLIFLLAFFVVSFFSNSSSQKLDGNFLVQATQSTYKIPNIPSLNLTNNTESTIVLLPCENIFVKSNGDILDFNFKKCSEVSIKSGEVFVLSLESEQKVFETLWTYNVDINFWDKEYTTQFKTKHRGTIGQLFIYLFYAPIYNLMAYVLSHVWYSLGFAIIIITIIVRLLLVYPQHKMLLNQKKMQTIQPKIKQIQEKHKWNQAVLWQELLGLYKKEGVNPLGSCWLLLIQMPVLIVIYHVIQSITDPSNYFYIYAFLQNFKIDSINPMFYGIDLLQSWGIVWIVLAILVGILQFIQVKLSLAKNNSKTEKGVIIEKKKDSNDFANIMPDPEMMNKFMLYGMPAMVAVFTYFFFAWLWLYWWMSTLFMIFQQHIINKIMNKSS